jgi:hypothetical protein
MVFLAACMLQEWWFRHNRYLRGKRYQRTGVTDWQLYLEERYGRNADPYAFAQVQLFLQDAVQPGRWLSTARCEPALPSRAPRVRALALLPLPSPRPHAPTRIAAAQPSPLAPSSHGRPSPRPLPPPHVVAAPAIAPCPPPLVVAAPALALLCNMHPLSFALWLEDRWATSLRSQCGARELRGADRAVLGCASCSKLASPAPSVPLLVLARL